MEILLGADPELFVKDKGKVISAHGLVKGDKENPFPVKDGAVQVDGMALEFNINPAKDEGEFVHNINSVMEQLSAMVPKFEIVAQPTAKFTEEYMLAQPKEALELGCEPDFNAWKNGEINPKPDQDKPMRTGAGHLHIGWTEGADIEDPSHLVDCMEVVKQLDAYLGVASVIFDPDVERRKMYGAAGAFRPKSYGVEYRVLSNYWLSSPELISWVYKTTRLAITDLLRGYIVPHRNLHRHTASPRSIIDNSERYNARMFMSELKVEVPNV